MKAGQHDRIFGVSFLLLFQLGLTSKRNVKWAPSPGRAYVAKTGVDQHFAATITKQCLLADPGVGNGKCTGNRCSKVCHDTHMVF
jgi:hypothetical protein